MQWEREIQTLPPLTTIVSMPPLLRIGNESSSFRRRCWERRAGRGRRAAEAGRRCGAGSRASSTPPRATWVEGAEGAEEAEAEEGRRRLSPSATTSRGARSLGRKFRGTPAETTGPRSSR